MANRDDEIILLRIPQGFFSFEETKKKKKTKRKTKKKPKKNGRRK